MLPGVIVGTFSLFALVALIVKDRYELHRFEHHLDKIPMIPLIALGRLALYTLYLEMGIYGILLIVSQGASPAYNALLAHLPFEEAIQVTGMIITILGLILAFWSLKQIDGQKLALTGPYRFVRHPIYLGLSIVVIGFLLSLLNLVALIPLLIIPAQVEAAKAEEGILVGRFGKRYSDYQQSVGMMIPEWKWPRSLK